MHSAPWANISMRTGSPEGPQICCSSIARAMRPIWSSDSSRASTTTSAHCEKNFTASEFEMLLWVEMWTSTPMRRAWRIAAKSEAMTASMPSALARSITS